MTEGRLQPLAALSEHARTTAMSRWAVLRPAIEDGVPLTRAAADADVALRTAQRWLSAYRACGLVGLAPPMRSDRGTRRTHPTLVAFVEGLALRRPAPSIAHVQRRTAQLAAENGWPAPSYATVRQIIRGLDPGLTTLAHDGPAAYRDGFELALRWEADAPNAIWQADHTQLDVMILDAAGRPARPWLTLIVDDYSRAVAGYVVEQPDNGPVIKWMRRNAWDGLGWNAQTVGEVRVRSDETLILINRDQRLLERALDSNKKLSQEQIQTRESRYLFPVACALYEQHEAAKEMKQMPTLEYVAGEMARLAEAVLLVIDQDAFAHNGGA